MAWGTEAACQVCGTKAFYQHANIAAVFNSPRAFCSRCQAPYKLTARGVHPGGVPAQEMAQAAPGSHLTPDNYQRCNLSPEERRDSTRILELALPGGIDP